MLYWSRKCWKMVIPDAGRRYSNILLQLGRIIIEKERFVLMIE